MGNNLPEIKKALKTLRVPQKLKVLREPKKPKKPREPKKPKKPREPKEPKEPQVLNHTQSKDEMKESTFLKLVKLFLQILAILVSCVGAYFAYRSYSNTVPNQIQLVYYDSNKDFKSENYMRFIVLLQTVHRDIIFGAHNGINTINECVLLPAISNNSNKSIKNFHLNVHTETAPFYFEEYDINKDFTIIRLDTTCLSADFEYKYDALYANSTISTPLDAIYLPDSTDLEDDFYMIMFDYAITYDGIKAPIHYTVLLYVYINDFISNVRDETLDSFFDLLYSFGFFDDYTVLISLCETNIPFLVIDSIDKNITRDKFEEYKFDIIKRYNNNM